MVTKIPEVSSGPRHRPLRRHQHRELGLGLPSRPDSLQSLTTAFVAFSLSSSYSPFDINTSTHPYLFLYHRRYTHLVSPRRSLCRDSFGITIVIIQKKSREHQLRNSLPTLRDPVLWHCLSKVYLKRYKRNPWLQVSPLLLSSSFSLSLSNSNNMSMLSTPPPYESNPDTRPLPEGWIAQFDSKWVSSTDSYRSTLSAWDLTLILFNALSSYNAWYGFSPNPKKTFPDKWFFQVLC